ncbi:unnamed protein product [Orchesella dallaii]|uniref:RING-type E3 ubiquitin transferase n=1 Tax=Orchesella dallaii TaxID=48710 RepID=A0ABP1PQT4_9HEXA
MTSEMTDVKLRELLLRKSFDFTIVDVLPDREALIEAFKCGVCRRYIGPYPTRVCDDICHPICVKCHKTHRKAMDEEKVLECPTLMDDKQCGNPVVGAVSIKFKFQCTDYFEKTSSTRTCVAAKMFGCSYSGSLQTTTEHEKYHCRFRHLLMCLKRESNHSAIMATCGRFQEPMRLNKHLMKRHGAVFTHHEAISVRLAFDQPAFNLTDKWVVLARVMINYRNGRFSMLMIDENYTHIRMYLVEVDPEVGKDSPGAPYSITFPFQPAKRGKSYEYSSQVLPYNASGFKVDDGAAHMYFHINKIFIRQHQEDDGGDGKVKFRILIKFMEPVSPTPLSSLVDTTSSTPQLSNSKLHDDLMEETIIEDSVEAVLDSVAVPPVNIMDEPLAAASANDFGVASRELPTAVSSQPTVTTSAKPDIYPLMESTATDTLKLSSSSCMNPTTSTKFTAIITAETTSSGPVETISTEEPTSSTPEEPTSSTPEEPTSSTPEEPTSSTPEEPTSSTPEEPTSSTPEEPTSSTPEEPTSSTPEEPTSSTPEEPTSSTPEEPTSSTPEEPTSSTPEEPTSSTPEEPTSSTPEEPTSSTPEEPTSSTPEEPTSSTPEEPTSSTPEEPTSSTPEEPVTSIPKESNKSSAPEKLVSSIPEEPEPSTMLDSNSSTSLVTTPSIPIKPSVPGSTTDEPAAINLTKPEAPASAQRKSTALAKSNAITSTKHATIPMAGPTTTSSVDATLATPCKPVSGEAKSVEFPQIADAPSTESWKAIKKQVKKTKNNVVNGKPKRNYRGFVLIPAARLPLIPDNSSYDENQLWTTRRQSPSQ